VNRIRQQQRRHRIAEIWRHETVIATTERAARCAPDLRRPATRKHRANLLIDIMTTLKLTAVGTSTGLFIPMEMFTRMKVERGERPEI